MVQSKAPSEGKGGTTAKAPAVDDDLNGIRQSIQRLSQEVQTLRANIEEARFREEQKFSEMAKRVEDSERRYRESGGRSIREGTQAGHLDDLPKTPGL